MGPSLQLVNEFNDVRIACVWGYMTGERDGALAERFSRSKPDRRRSPGGD